MRSFPFTAVVFAWMAGCSLVPQSPPPALAVVEANLPRVCDLRRMRDDATYVDLEILVDREQIRVPLPGADLVVPVEGDHGAVAPAIQQRIALILENDRDVVLADFRVVMLDDAATHQTLIRALDLAPPGFERTVVAGAPARLSYGPR